MSVIKMGTNDSCPGFPEDTLESDPAICHGESHMKKNKNNNKKKLSVLPQEHSTSRRG